MLLQFDESLYVTVPLWCFIASAIVVIRASVSVLAGASFMVTGFRHTIKVALAT